MYTYESALFICFQYYFAWKVAVPCSFPQEDLDVNHRCAGVCPTGTLTVLSRSNSYVRLPEGIIGKSTSSVATSLNPKTVFQVNCLSVLSLFKANL